MKQVSVKKEKVNHTFTITISDHGSVKLDGEWASYKEGQIKLFSPAKINGVKFGGINVEGKEREEIEAYITAAKATYQDEQEKDRLAREADRPAPHVDEEKFLTYKVGFDTHQIYPRDKAKAIKRALKNGAKREKVYRGSRAQSQKYPGQYDSNIPESYYIDGENTPGYSAVWHEDLYAILLSEVQKAEAELEAELEAERNAKKAERKNKFAEAATTGKPVVLEMWIDECNDPDESCDIDNICVYAMPDGTEKTERHHTW